MTDTTNQEVGGSEPAAVAEGVDTEALNQGLTSDEGNDEPPEPEYDADGNQIDPPEDVEELEFEGVKGKVPKALAEQIKLGAMRTADYTRKTQEVAQHRAAVEQEAQQVRANLAEQQELATAHIQDLAALTNLNGQLSQFEALTPADWEAIRQQDRLEGTDKVGDLRWQYDQLRRQRDGTLTQLQQKAAQREADKQRDAATHVSQARAVLERDIPGWGTPKLTELQAIAQEFGVPAAVMGQVVEPGAYKVLNEIARLRAALNKNTTATTAHRKVATAQAAAPVPKVGGASPTTRKSPEQMSPEEYQAWRRASSRPRGRDGKYA